MVLSPPNFTQPEQQLPWKLPLHVRIPGELYMLPSDPFPQSLGEGHPVQQSPISADSNIAIMTWQLKCAAL